jgi:hypothetical protein
MFIIGQTQRTEQMIKGVHSSRLIAAIVAITLLLGSQNLKTEPAQPGSNSTSTVNPVPLKPEPKEYVDISGGGAATGTPFSGSGGPTCWPNPPSGMMTISGGGEILLDGKAVTELTIGSGASKKGFEWKPDPAQGTPKKKDTNPPVNWNCAGGAQFQKGFQYSVTVAFQGNSRPCGATTTITKPSSVDGGILVWNDTTNYSSATVYVPRIKTTTSATAKSNPNGWRKKIGVGEIVNCALEGTPGGTVTWLTSGAGCTISGSGNSATFTAGDEATSATVTATFNGTFSGQAVSGSASVTLTVVAPAGLTGAKEHEGYASFNNPNPPPSGTVFTAAAMEVRWHLVPDDVSYYRVQTQEGSCDATEKRGVYRQRNRMHDVMDWQTYQQNNDGSIPDVVVDVVGAPQNTLPPTFYGYDQSTTPPTLETGGSYKWIIPWTWRVGETGAPKAGGTNPHEVTVTESGLMTIKKLGQQSQDGPFVAR